MSHIPSTWYINANGAEVCEDFSTTEHNCIAHIHGDGEKRTANARLIAAAPKLLKACQAALVDLKRWEYYSSLWDEQDTKTMNRLENAIAAAEGNDA